MNYERFITAQEGDFKGRTLGDIWSFSDAEVEYTHDFIQIIFPLDKPSQAAFHGYYLDSEDLVQKLSANEQARTNIIKSAQWFLGFLGRNTYWNKGHDHNQLRITRVIESLRLLVSDEEADRFYARVMELVSDENKINSTTLAFWEKA